MGSEVSTSLRLAMPREQAWQILQDFACAHNYVPGIVRTEITTAVKNGVGASRKVYDRRGQAMDETITEWHEGEGFRIRLHKGARDAPFRNSYFVYRLADGPDNSTELTTIMGYTPPFGWLGKLLDALLLRRIIGAVIRDVAISMKYFYEHGRRPGKQDLRRLKAQLKTQPHLTTQA